MAQPNMSRRPAKLKVALVAGLCVLALVGTSWFSSSTVKQTLLGANRSFWAPASSCPLEFRRQSYADIRTFKKKPYLVGGNQEPNCTHCQVDDGLAGLVILMILPVMSPQSLARFNVSTRSATAGYCQRLTCPKEEQRGFLEHLISRAELGAPGYEAMLTMTPCDWWPLLANRTLWLVGDSLSQEFMKAFQCFMYEFWDLDMVDLKHRVVEADFVRDKVRLGWCAHLLEGARICHHRVNDAPEYTAVLPYFYQGLTGKRNDIVMMNTGIWSNDVDTYTSRLSTFAQYYQQHKQELPFFVWRDSSAQFFHTPTGDFDRSEHAVCQPIGYPSGGVTLDSSNKLVSDLETSPQLQVVHEGGWRNQISRPVMHALGIPVIETWNKSIPIWQYHKNAHDDPNHHDCTHWCHPSAYLMWLYDSLVTLQKLQPAIAEHVRQMPSQEQLDELDLKAGAEHIVVDPF